MAPQETVPAVGCEEDPVPPVDVLDQLAVKRTVDDCICKIIEIEGYKEDLVLSNVKLVLMSTACAVALFAQLGPLSFPEDKVLLTGCVIFYAVASALLQVIASFIERDYIIRTLPKEGGISGGLLVSTFMDRGEENIKVCLEMRNSSEPCVEEYSSSVGCYFAQDGELDEQAVQADLYSCLSKLESRFAQQAGKKNA